MIYYPGELLTPLTIGKEAARILHEFNPTNKLIPFDVSYKRITGALDERCVMVLCFDGEKIQKEFTSEDLKLCLEEFSKMHIKPLVYSMKLATYYFLSGQVNFTER